MIISGCISAEYFDLTRSSSLRRRLPNPKAAVVKPVESIGHSGCSAVVVPQHPTDPLSTFDLADNGTHFRARCDESILKSVMISLDMIILEKRGHGPAKRMLAEEDQSGETFFLDRPHKTFQVRIEIGRLQRQPQALHVRQL